MPSAPTPMPASHRWLPLRVLCFAFMLASAAAAGPVASQQPVEFQTDSLSRAVFQRDANGTAQIPVRAVITADVARVQARAVPRRGFPGVSSGWQTVRRDVSPGEITLRVSVASGWYDLEFRALDKNGHPLAAARAPRVGVGEVFITAGQSNSVNAAPQPTAPADERVSAFDVETGAWRHAYDPQPVGGQFPSYAGQGGSPWPALGDRLTRSLGVPVGFLSTGAGGSSIDDWAVSADYDSSRNDLDVPSLYSTNLAPAIRALSERGGFRAILFHQGESDSISGADQDQYGDSLERIIQLSRDDAGYDVPWAVAVVSYYRYSNTGDGQGLFNVPDLEERIADAQRSAIARNANVFQGAVTDTLGEPFRPLETYPPDFSQRVHFNSVGLELHADLWAAALVGQGVIPSPSPSINLIANGGFEHGLAAGWAQPDSGGISDDAYAGRAAFAAPNTGGLFHDPIPLAPGHYELAFNARADGEISRVFTGVKTETSGVVPIERSFPLDSNWSRPTLRFSLAEPAVVQPWVWGSNDPGTTGRYLIDNVTLRTADVIDHPQKIGIGTGVWKGIEPEQVGQDVDRIGASWYYTWQPNPPKRAAGAGPTEATFIPMVWGERDFIENVPTAVDRRAMTLLPFNEPDNTSQSDLSVDQAIRFWPELEALGLRIGSPCNSSGPPDPSYAFLGEHSWLRRFMTRADDLGLRIDFMALHYYTDEPDVERMRRDLEAAHALYGRPIWLTEWALVDWENTDRFTLEETAQFAAAASRMMDDLPFLERHAWFAMYPGGDGWYIQTELVDQDGKQTVVGNTFRKMLRSEPMP
ncbi:MAG: glycosyl hydrolase [Planctomycetota bacterium]